ncbi:MAG: hypothetical protein ABII27_02830 [bacterium]
MQRIIIFLLFCISLTGILNASFEEKFLTARETYLGGAYTADNRPESVLIKNPASLGFKKSSSLSFSHSELFSLDDLDNQIFSFIFPTEKFGNWAVNYSEFGPEIYKEKEIGIDAGFMLIEELFLGFRIKNESLSIRNYGSASSSALDAGSIALLSDNISCGVYARNVVAERIGKSDERPQKSCRLGLGYAFNNFFMSVVDLEKNFLDKNIIYHLGQEIRFSEAFLIGIGWESNPGRFSCGFGIATKLIALEYAFISHPYLDIEHHISINCYLFRE